MENGEHSPEKRPKRVKVSNVDPWGIGGLFTLPDGSGGTVDDLDEYWDHDTWRETRQAQQVLEERMAIEHPPSELWFRRLKYSSKVVTHNMRAIKAGNIGNLTDEEWDRIVAAFGGLCAYCGEEPRPIHLEHVVPIKKGGGTTLTNVVPACRRCNTSKNSSTPEEWIWLIPHYWDFRDRHERALQEVAA